MKEHKTPEQFYEKSRLAGETYNITSNDHPNYHEPFYQCIFRLMEKYSDQQNAELRERVKELEAQVSDLTEIVNGINGCRKISLPWPEELENRVNKLWEDLK